MSALESELKTMSNVMGMTAIRQYLAGRMVIETTNFSNNPSLENATNLQEVAQYAIQTFSNESDASSDVPDEKKK